MMKRQIITVKFERSRTRAEFLFNSGQFKPKSVKSAKQYSRRNKHRNRVVDFA